MVSRRKPLLRILIPVAAVIGLLALAGSAYAGADIQRFDVPGSLTFPVNDPCRGLTGQATATFVTTVQDLQTQAGHHVLENTSGSLDITYSDGSQAHGTFVKPSEFMFTSGLGQPAATSTATSALAAKVTVYDLNDQVVGTETIHWLQHTTVTIVEAQPPIVHSSIDTSTSPLFTCGG